MNAQLLVAVLLCARAGAWWPWGDSPHPSGAAPGDGRYTASFRCHDNRATRQLGLGAVNDGYCDCLDGSDEPGTPACPNGQFWCAGEARYISTSLLGDGVCDCCDGSDEGGWNLTSCEDRCQLRRRKLAQEQAVTMRTNAEGRAAFDGLVATGKQARVKVGQEHAKNHGMLKQTIEAMHVMKPKLEAMHQQGEASAEREQLERQWMGMKQQAEALQKQGQRMEQMLRGFSDPMIAMADQCVRSPPINEKRIRGGAVTAIPKVPTRAGPALTTGQVYSFIVCPFSVVWQRWEEDQQWEFDSCVAEIGAPDREAAARANSTCANKTAAAHKQAMAPLLAAEQYCQTLDAKVVQDCIKHHHGQHSQQMEGKLRTMLGQYMPGESDPTSVWYFQDRSQPPCSNGMQREVNVTIVCGYGHSGGEGMGRLISVAENGICSYEMRLESPLGCATPNPPPPKQQATNSETDDL